MVKYVCWKKEVSKFSNPGAQKLVLEHSNFCVRCAKNQFESYNQVALPYQICSNNEDPYQSIGGNHKW